jgi:hypothetical protein
VQSAKYGYKANNALEIQPLSTLQTRVDRLTHRLRLFNEKVVAVKRVISADAVESNTSENEREVGERDLIQIDSIHQ